METIRFQWIRWTLSERLSTPSSNMSKIFLYVSVTNRKLTFSWNLFVSNGSNGLAPLERHSTPSNNMSGIFLSLSRIENYFSIGIYSCVMSNGSPTLVVGCFTTRLPVFQWNGRGYYWSLGDSIGQPSISLQTIFTLTYLTSLGEMSKLRKT